MKEVVGYMHRIIEVQRSCGADQEKKDWAKNWSRKRSSCAGRLKKRGHQEMCSHSKGSVVMD